MKGNKANANFSGKPAQVLHYGDAVEIPPDVEYRQRNRCSIIYSLDRKRFFSIKK
jgi:hypothetical protein